VRGDDIAGGIDRTGHRHPLGVRFDQRTAKRPLALVFVRYDVLFAVNDHIWVIANLARFHSARV
jgi:hypothetical protein